MDRLHRRQDLGGTDSWRGRRTSGIGRGSNGEVWKFEENLSDLVSLCMGVLSDKPLFFLINSYTTGISSQVLEDILRINMRDKKGKFSNGEIGLPMKDSKLILPCGIYGRYEE